MAIFATNGAKLFIGTVITDKATDFLLSDFSGQVWTEVKHTEGLGSLGDSSAEITFDSLGQSRTKHLKGTRNAGAMEVVIGLDNTDAGQIALQMAEKSHENFAFKIVLNDAPPGGTSSERLFIALVGSVVEAYDTANNVVKLNASLRVNSNTVKVSAASSGAAPDNTALPSITGTAEVGETLTASPGTWTGTAPIAYGYQWFVGGEAISGANTTTYVPVAGDAGKAVSVLVSASNSAGIRQAISAATSAVAP